MKKDEERGKQNKEMHAFVSETSVWMFVHAIVTCHTDDHKSKIAGRIYFPLPTSEIYARESLSSTEMARLMMSLKIFARKTEIRSEAALIVSMSALQEKSLKQSITFTAFYLACTGRHSVLIPYCSYIWRTQSFNNIVADMVRNGSDVPKFS